MRISAPILALLCAVLCSAQPGSPLKGSISGRVVDQSGRPMGNVRVAAWRWNYREGRKELDQVTRDGPVT